MPPWKRGLFDGCTVPCSRLCCVSYLPCFGTVGTRIAAKLGYSPFVRVLLFAVATLCALFPLLYARLPAVSFACGAVLVCMLAFLRGQAREDRNVDGVCGSAEDVVCSGCCFCCVQQQVYWELYESDSVTLEPDFGCECGGCEDEEEGVRRP